MTDLANNLGYYIGQYVLVKTAGEDILMIKVLRKRKKLNGLDVRILKKNDKKLNIDSFICRNEMKMICVLPHDVQDAIDLTINYKPLIENIKDKNIASEVHFGKRSNDEI